MSALAYGGALLGSGGLALLLVGPRRDTRSVGLGLWGVGLVLLALYLLPDVSRALLAAGAAGGLVVAVLGAAALLRWPYLLAFATLACIPARLPVDLGTERANLLVPLYGVVAAFALALGWRLVRGDGRACELGPLARPLAALVLWLGTSIAWTVDLRKGAIFLGAFVLPFGLLSIGFARLPWRGRWLAWLWGALVATALAYAAVGAYQWATRDVFWNPSVIVGNAYAPFFRVNSVFWDPSIYGRYLAVAILATLAGILLGGVRGRRVLGLYAVVVATWLGLLLSFSQSSFVTLSAGIVVAAAVAWGRRAVVGLVGLTLLTLALSLAVPQLREQIVDRSSSGLNKITSGRSNLVAQGVRIVADRPLTGVGVGGFRREYARRTGVRGDDPRRVASHTAPLTLAAEGGLPALALFGWVVVVAALATLVALGRGFTSRVSLAVGVALVAVLVHSLFYSAYFEDPLTWALLGLVGLCARVPKRRSPTARADGRADYAAPTVVRAPESHSEHPAPAPEGAA